MVALRQNLRQDQKEACLFRWWRKEETCKSLDYRFQYRQWIAKPGGRDSLLSCKASTLVVLPDVQREQARKAKKLAERMERRGKASFPAFLTRESRAQSGCGKLYDLAESACSREEGLAA